MATGGPSRVRRAPFSPPPSALAPRKNRCRPRQASFRSPLLHRPRPTRKPFNESRNQNNHLHHPFCNWRPRRPLPPIASARKSPLEPFAPHLHASNVPPYSPGATLSVSGDRAGEPLPPIKKTRPPRIKAAPTAASTNPRHTCGTYRNPTPISTITATNPK